MSGARSVVFDADRLERRDHGPLVAALAISLLLHLLVLFLASMAMFRPSEPPEPEEISVPLTFVEPEQAAPAPRAEPAQPVEPADELAQGDDQPQVDESLLGFSSPEGEIEARPTRPQGPESDIHAPPAPVDAPEGEIAPDAPEEAPEDVPDAALDDEEEPAEEVPADSAEEPTPDVVQPAPEESGEPAPMPEDETGTPAEVPAREPEAPRTGRAPLPFPPVPDRTEARPARPRPDRSRVRRVPDFDAPVSGGFWADNLRFDSRDYDWSEYSTKVYFAVYRAWLRELYGRIRRFERDQAMLGLPGLDGQVTIHFTLHRDGSVGDLQVLDSSQLPTLDAASSAALLRAVLPPLPDDFPRDAEGVTFRFRISGFETASQMERQLRYRQYRGEF